MSTIYSLDSERNIFIYSVSHTIYLRSSQGELLSRPVLLSNDYQSQLTDVIYQGTIYYAYINTSQDIIIKNITDQTILYQKSSQESPDCFQPYICVFMQTLLLFYFIKNPVNDTFLLKCISPFVQEPKLAMDLVFPILPTLQIYSSKNTLLLFLTMHEQKEQVYLLNTTFTLCQLQPDAFYHSLLSKQIEESTQQLNLLQKEHQTELSQVISNFQEIIHKRDLLIESIKKQYNELMDTATKYRAEAMKWREKFLKR